ncbi:DUF4142 domain-containing protein [Flavobacterium sp. 3HN19-14]|uniref:DUF4142 domain-containing protein n=1 Tax=Flavobacterium sp. 3HN19-14 TaxID=3448133 RepID=UPI003EE0E835
MKNLYFLLLICGLSSFTYYRPFENDKAVEKFLREMADARMMDTQEGQLAAERGTTKAIRDYGAYMVKDEAILMMELNKVAAAKNITLPKAISNEKSKALDKLKEKTGTDFDKKFIKMITIDHKRDVRKFTKAAEFDDAEVSAFATKYLPTIQMHLEGSKKIKEAM